MSLRYVALDICKNYGMNPETEWNRLSNQVKAELIAKRQLEIERDIRLREKQKNS